MSKLSAKAAEFTPSGITPAAPSRPEVKYQICSVCDGYIFNNSGTACSNCKKIVCKAVETSCSVLFECDSEIDENGIEIEIPARLDTLCKNCSSLKGGKSGIKSSSSNSNNSKPITLGAKSKSGGGMATASASAASSPANSSKLQERDAVIASIQNMAAERRYLAIAIRRFTRLLEANTLSLLQEQEKMKRLNLELQQMGISSPTNDFADVFDDNYDDEDDDYLNDEYDNELDDSNGSNNNNNNAASAKSPPQAQASIVNNNPPSSSSSSSSPQTQSKRIPLADDNDEILRRLSRPAQAIFETLYFDPKSINGNVNGKLTDAALETMLKKLEKFDQDKKLDAAEAGLRKWLKSYE